MALNNLAGLRAAALAWIERTGDPAAETIVDDCVTLCESRINKTPDFRISHMETSATIVLEDGSAYLPGDFLAMKRVVAATSTPYVLDYAEPGTYGPTASAPLEGQFYTIVGLKIRARTSSTLTILYYARVPALTGTDNTNWLLSKAPDIYLYGTIMEMLNALEGEGVEKYAGLFSGALESLIQSETYSRGGVLTQRASMPAP
jgi:hypothetical protein